MEESQLVQYIPVLILAGIATLTAVGILVASVVVGKWANKIRRNTKTKNIPYECGMLPMGE